MLRAGERRRVDSRLQLPLHEIRVADVDDEPDHRDQDDHHDEREHDDLSGLVGGQA